MPYGLRQIGDIKEFAAKYYERLDSFGVDNWCNRNIFAKCRQECNPDVRAYRNCNGNKSELTFMKAKKLILAG